MMSLSTEMLAGRRVMVVGFGRQGQALARWLPMVGARVLVNDTRDADTLALQQRDWPGVQFLLGRHPDHVPDDVELICVSGGVPLDLPVLEEARLQRIPISNDAQLFVERCPAPIIGITGSAGKTTTTTLIGEMFKLTDRPTWVGGNIGKVLLDVMVGIRPSHQVVMELSSFQLELMHTSPKIAAVLNVTPNHLDRHGTMENYLRAKAHILAFQERGDRAILCRDEPGSRALETVVRGDLLWFSMREMVSDGAFVAGQRLLVTGLASPDGNPHVVCERDDIPLRGEHNLLNVLAACAIAGAGGIEPETMTEAIKAFKSVPHRLEQVRVLDGVAYINDSIATAPERVLAALKSYSEPMVLLAGGADKKLSWDEMISLALLKTRHIIAFGRDGDIVVETAKRLSGSPDHVTRVNTLDEAVSLASSITQTGDIVLLSPGGTSYDAYQNFEARGEHFRQLVLAL